MTEWNGATGCTASLAEGSVARKRHCAWSGCSSAIGHLVLFLPYFILSRSSPSSTPLLTYFYPRSTLKLTTTEEGRRKREEGRNEGWRLKAEGWGLKHEGLRLSFYLPALSSASSFLHRATSIFTSSSLRRKKEDVRRKSYFPPNSWSSFLQRATRIFTSSSASSYMLWYCLSSR